MTCPIVDIVVEELQARPRPKDVGMLAMEMHFLRRCISEEELEVFDGVSKGKYTIALGLQYMAFADDREDINPSALTAPIVFESIHGTYMTDTYDFYKPRLDFEYPEVDGPLSVTSYLAALDMSYSSFGEKTGPGRAVTHDDPDSTFSLDDTAYHVFHCPYGKIVQKGHARLLYNDSVADPSAPKFSSIDHAFAKDECASRVVPSMYCAKRCGNMYTALRYGGLASLISAGGPADLRSKRVSMFACGRGAASSSFTLHVKGDTTQMRDRIDLQRGCRLCRARSELTRSRCVYAIVTLEYLTHCECLQLREVNHGRSAYEPGGPSMESGPVPSI